LPENESLASITALLPGERYQPGPCCGAISGSVRLPQFYERGRGILRRRVADPEDTFEHPLRWPASEAIAIGSPIAWDSGNANATVIGDIHYVSFYSGEAPDTDVVVSEVPAPMGDK
tara:strand:+ start:695 stop:1045 length:351 start_codon:yes stop_codon:yes gene_type:complete